MGGLLFSADVGISRPPWAVFFQITGPNWILSPMCFQSRDAGVDRKSSLKTLQSAARSGASVHAATFRWTSADLRAPILAR